MLIKRDLSAWICERGGKVWDREKEDFIQNLKQKEMDRDGGGS